MPSRARWTIWIGFTSGTNEGAKPMAFGQVHNVSITASTTAVGSGLTEVIPYGYVQSIQVTLGTFSTTMDITVTTANTSRTILTQSNIVADTVIHPRVEVVTTAGVSAGAYEKVMVVNEAIKIDVVQAGNGGAGSFKVTIV